MTNTGHDPADHRASSLTCRLRLDLLFARPPVYHAPMRVGLVLLVCLAGCLLPAAELVGDPAGAGAAGASATTTSAGGGTSAGGASCVGSDGGGTSTVPCNGLELWLDAAILTTTGALAKWPDKSPAQRPVHQDLSALQPTVIAGEPRGLNGRSVVKFNPSGNSLQVDGSFHDFTAGLSSIAVITPRAETPGMRQIVWYLGTDPVSAKDAVSVAEDGSGWFYDSGEYGTTQFTTGLTVGEAAILELYALPGGAVHQLICGKETAVNAVDLPTVAERTRNFIGNSDSTKAIPFNGDLAELLVYSRSLMSMERTVIQGYLKDKWHVCSGASER
jgi:hypothetical protein